MRAWSPARKILPIAVLLLSVLAVFAQTKGHDFIELDDPPYVSGNPVVRQGLTWNGLIWAFSTTHMANWHPLTWVSHMIDVSVFGVDPGWHHLVNVAIHGANAIFLFLLLCDVTGAPFRSGFVAALFAVHPLHVESVAWVAERKDLLSALFSLLAMRTYVRYARHRSTGRYVLTTAFFALALLSKPMAVTLPFVLLLLDWWPLERAQDGRSARFLVLEKVPLFVLSALSSAVTYFAQQSGGAVRSLESIHFGFRLANAVASYARYLAKTIWPSTLAVYYPHPWTGDAYPGWGETVFAAVVLAGVTAIAVRLGRRHRYFAVGWFWYLGMLVPVIGLVQVGEQAMADRYTYLPLIGIFLIAAWGAADLVSTSRHRTRILSFVGAGALVVLAAAAHVQAGYWRNSVELFSHTLSVTRNNFVVHNNLGTIYVRSGDLERAEGHFREALRINPRRAFAYYNIGNVLVRQRKYDLAIPYLRKALEIDPDYVKAHYDLGVILCDRGFVAEGVRHLEAVLRVRPNDPVVRALLAAHGAR